MLRRMAMMGDAISHAVLPGIVLAFLWTESRNPWVMLVGALCLGFVMTYLVQILTQRIRLQSDAAIGMSFTALFALGVVLVTAYAGQVDLDQECVLYGEIAYVPIDLWMSHSGEVYGPRALYIMGTTLLLTIVFVSLFYRPLMLISFDEAYAHSLGLSTQFWHYVLMGAVSFVVVAAFEVVGAVLVIAFLVVPPASAYLITHRLPLLLILSSVYGVGAVWSGYYLAVWSDTSIAGAIASTAGIGFALTFLYTYSRKRRTAADASSLKKYTDSMSVQDAPVE